MRWIVILILTFFISIESTAVDLTGLFATDPQPKGEWTKLVIPLKRSGNLLLIEATIDSVKGDFIIDTGAPYLVLNRTYFRQYETNKTVQSAGVNSGMTQASRCAISKVSFGKLYYENVDADITSLTQLENSKKIKILGLIGCNFFTSLCIKIDILTNQMIIYKLDEKGNPIAKIDSTSQGFERDTTPDIAMKFKLCDNKIFVPVSIAGQDMNWILDTGAETNVVDALAKKKILKEFTVVRRVKLTGSTGSQEVILGVFSELNIGEMVFPMQQTMMTNMAELNETCSIFIDGILGYNFLSQGTFSLNFATKEFSLYLYKSE
jgi:predicted aspartyl protease